MDEPRRKRLGEILVAEGLLSVAQLEDALVAQADSPQRERLGVTVVRLGLARERDVSQALAHQLGLDSVDLTRTTPDPKATSLVPRALAMRHLALPLQVIGDELVVAMADPTNVVAIDDLRITGGVSRVKPVVATVSDLREAINLAYGSDRHVIQALATLEADEIDGPAPDIATDITELARSADDQPIVRLANGILTEAVRNRASDIHVEPGRRGARVRYRIDGMLREAQIIPKGIQLALISRLKLIAGMDIAERRRPQDGRTVITAEGQEVDLRVSSMPTLFGETIVLRLLRKGEQRLAMEAIGFHDDHLALFRQTMTRPQGLVLLTGPTGSGKTSTLYAGMSEIASEANNVITLEDPIEYQLEGVNQTQINEKTGLTFARGLRTVLRQDPDIIMVGEIRDEETAQLAIQASYTGHLVLSTLHTNDAPSTVLRLLDLGIEPFHIASTLLLVASQRLVRVVCDHCAEETEPSERTLALLGMDRSELKGKRLMRGRGCELCHRTGYRGRTGIFELLPITSPLRELVVQRATETQIAKMSLEEGMRTLREDAILKAYEGVTTLEEVVRVTPPPSGRLDPNRQLRGEAAQLASFGSALTRPGAAVMVTRVMPPVVTDEPQVTTDEEVAPEDRPLVLVVDDDESVRQFCEAQLSDRFNVIVAADGNSALDAAREHSPSAMVLDLKLPDIDGIEVTRKLRAEPDVGRLAIVMITGVDDPAAELEGLLAGVDDYVTKPLDGDVLGTRVQAAIERSKVRSS